MPVNVKKLSAGWMIDFLFVVSFVGLFSTVPLRKLMILKYKLTYPSGTTTAYLINSFHTPKGNKLWFSSKALSFAFCLPSSNGFTLVLMDVDFLPFPTFGFQAYKQRFYFDFSSTYVGMICPYMVNVSLLVGAIFSRALMWPMIENKKGIWYSADLESNNLHGL